MALRIGAFAVQSLIAGSRLTAQHRAATLVGGFTRLAPPPATPSPKRTHTGVRTSMATSAVSTTGAVVVYVTVPSAEVGDTLAGKLVEAKLAACVNIVPGLTSVYWWDGKINKDPELLLIVKTREELLAELTTFVKANHPYQECEVLALPVLGGSPSYIKWVLDSTAAQPQ